MVNFVSQIENHHIFLLASAIAFNVILYVIPLILVGIYITNLVFGATNFNSIIAEIILTFMPETEESYLLISKILLEINKIFKVSNFVGIVGVLSLLWLSSTVFSSVRNSLNIVFEAKATKVFVFYKLQDVVLTIILSVFILILSYFLPLVNLISQALFDNLPQNIAFLLKKATIQIAWITVYFLFFLFVYLFLPNIKLKFNFVVFCALLCTVFAEASRHFFTYYINNIANYSRFYGAYGFVAGIVIWIYYLFFIILFSGEISRFVFSRFFNKSFIKEK